jgi:hypothetical protein
MVRILKTFLLWLLIAALPIQGMASVIKASCGPRHHNLPSTAAVVEHAHNANAASYQHAAFDADAFMTVAIEVTGGPESALGSEQPMTASYCSACAACCTGAVAPPASLSIASTFITAEAAVLPPATSFTGFIPAGLERPPKHLSA